MSAFYTSKVVQKPETNTYSVIYELDSSYIPYGMQENFFIMEKTPDYLFAYFKMLFADQNLDQQHTLNFTQKSLDSDKTQIEIKTNNIDFLKQLTHIVSNLEEHFNILLNDYSAFDNIDNFVEKLEKFNLYNKLNHKLEEKKISSARKKI